MEASSVADGLTVRSTFREYEVRFSTDAVGDALGVLDPAKTFVVCDARVAQLWGEYLRPLLIPDRHVLVDPTESSKTIDKTQELIEAMVAAGTRRDHRILAIGGGITQDVTAFAASILYRGLEWVFIPTTLLAQADSCIGSKTSINVGDKKNLVGNFWPPAFAFIDTRFLDTLPVDDVRSGIGEMLHFYYYANTPLIAPLIANYDSVLAERSSLKPYIAESLTIKRKVAELDEFDRGERHKFNYGHTFGHALESLTSFAIPHGQAVTVGMDLANFVSMKLGMMPADVFASMHEQLRTNFPGRRGLAVDIDRYCTYLGKDKKNLGANVGCILASGPGKLIPRQVPMNEDFKKILRDYFEGSFWA
jgi:3-dehydroquinate synthase